MSHLVTVKKYNYKGVRWHFTSADSESEPPQMYVTLEIPNVSFDTEVPSKLARILRGGLGTAPVCLSCNDAGWILADNDVHGLRIERCDACEKFDSDGDAVKHVADLAEAAAQKEGK